jgi:hypothetical protein
MTQNQFGEPAAPASSIQAGGEVNVGIVAEDEQLNLSIKKLQQACRKTVTTTVVVASIVQSEAAQWVEKMEALFKQEMGSAEIVSQTVSQFQEWFTQINQAIESVKSRSQPTEADLVTFAGTDSIKIEDLLGAIAGMRKIVAQIDYCQAEVEVKQALFWIPAESESTQTSQSLFPTIVWMEASSNWDVNIFVVFFVFRLCLIIVFVIEGEFSLIAIYKSSSINTGSPIEVYGKQR